MHRKWVLLVAGLALLMLQPGARTEQGTAKQPNPAEDAIMQTLTALAEAYNKGDAAALAALWSENGIYVSHHSGETAKGRKEIEKEFAAQFAKGKKNQLQITVHSIRLITPEVASVDGSAQVTKPEDATFTSTYTMILVKMQGQWRIDNVRETELPTHASHHSHLKELAWMIGEWQHKNQDTEVRIVCEWFTNKNFMARHFTVLEKGEVQHQGMQIVGWDPVHKKIRSWVYEIDGSFGEGFWNHEGKSWTVKVAGVLPGGKKSTATQVLTKVDNNKYTWQIVARTLDNQVLPNVEAVTVTRVPTPVKKEGE
jgi:uncharacterized protein (TIGR02246 family)